MDDLRSLGRVQFLKRVTSKVMMRRFRRGEDGLLCLKAKQIQATLASCDDNFNKADVLAVLATGYGKTLLFELIGLPGYYRMCTNTKRTISIVIAPLNALIDQHVLTLGSGARKLNSRMITIDLSSEDDDFLDSIQDEDDHDYDQSGLVSGITSPELIEGNFDFLVGHPEDFLATNTLEIFRKCKWSGDVSHIIVDEAHCVVQWSQDFRPKYRDIDQLRAIFPNASVLAVTATATVTMQEEIIRLLNMKNPKTVIGQTNRDNIKYVVQRRPSHAGKGRTVEDSYTSVFAPLLVDLKKKRERFKKTVVYSMLKWCGFGNELAVKILSDGTLSRVTEVQQYHAPLPAELKVGIAQDMMLRNGQTKLLLATPAFGLGVNCPDIRRVVHAGVPSTLEAYCQESGRAGRDGQPAEAVILYNKEDLGKENVRKEVKDYCNLTSCRRKFLSLHFKAHNSDEVIDDFCPALLHDCCDNCSRTCECGQCAISKEGHTSTVHDREQHSESEDEHQDDLIVEVVEMTLSGLFDAINSTIECSMDTCLVTGLTQQLAVDIALNYRHLTDLDALTVMYSYLALDYLRAIHTVIRECVSQWRSIGMEVETRQV